LLNVESTTGRTDFYNGLHSHDQLLKEMNMSDRFADRVAVITGGASGIGLAVAKQIAAEGGRVALWDLDAGKLQAGQSRSGASYAHVVDVTDPSSVEEAIAATVENLGPVDILVTSAGIIGPFRPVSDLSYEDWSRISAVNLDGTFLCCKAVVPAMRDRGYGRIATVASIAGKEGVPGERPTALRKPVSSV
jgi:NAD(P)-dependent dehydrogenase (short-subunit alcohol dehydrogenase family)